MRSSALRTGMAVLRMQQFREQLGLIETALAFPRRMQRDRHDQIEAASREARIAQRLAQPIGERMAQMDLPAVFELVHDLPDDARGCDNPKPRHRSADADARNWRRKSCR